MNTHTERTACEAAEQAVAEATCHIDNALDVRAGFDPDEEPAIAPIMARLREALLAYALAVLAHQEAPQEVAEAMNALAAESKGNPISAQEWAPLIARMERALARWTGGAA
jgi:hypothetical protein